MYESELSVKIMGFEVVQCKYKLWVSVILKIPKFPSIIHCVVPENIHTPYGGLLLFAPP